MDRKEQLLSAVARFTFDCAIAFLFLMFSMGSLAFGQFLSSTTLMVSPGAPSLGEVVTLTATVTPGATGRLAFYDGIVLLGSAELSGNVAIFSTILNSSGFHNLFARYVGDGAYATSQSQVSSVGANANPSNGFVSAASPITGLSPRNLYMADVDNDGRADLVTLNYGEATISVLIGNGDGTFQPKVSYSVGMGPVSAAIADFNNDGKLDLIVASQVDSNFLSILMNQGDGTFGTATHLISMGFPQTVLTSDVDGDGNADLLISYLSGSLELLLGLDPKGAPTPALRRERQLANAGVWDPDVNVPSSDRAFAYGTASLLASGPADQIFTTTPVKATFDAPASFVFTVTRTTSG